MSPAAAIRPPAAWRANTAPDLARRYALKQRIRRSPVATRREGTACGSGGRAAVILDPKNIPRGLNDSKKLSHDERENLYLKICASAEVAVAFGSTARIDRDNIRQASLWALARAVAALPAKPRLVFVDGCDRIDVDCECRSVISGDALLFSIAAASIVAKVTRDRLMKRIGALHPGYGFERHMGYGVPEHLRALDQLGPTIHHRRSFAPVAAFYSETLIAPEIAQDNVQDNVRKLPL